MSMGSFVGNVGGSDRYAGRGGVRALVWECVQNTGTETRASAGMGTRASGATTT